MFQHDGGPVTDLLMDSSDGRLLCAVVGHCLKTKVRGVSKDAKMNISLALDTADESELTVADIEKLNVRPLIEFYWKLVSRTLEDPASLRARLGALVGEPETPVAGWADGQLLAKAIGRKRDGLLKGSAAPGEQLLADGLFLLETQFALPPRTLEARDLQTEDERVLRLLLPFVADAFGGHAPAPAPAAVAAEKTPPKPKITIERSSAAEPAATFSSPERRSVHAVEKAVEVVKGSAKLANSKSVLELHRGISYSSVEIGGQNVESTAKCEVCAHELGAGKCFKFAIDGKPEFVHSRCFTCGICRKDFSAGIFFLNAKNSLVCVKDKMHEEGVVCKSCDNPIVDYYVEACGSRLHESPKCFACQSCKTPLAGKEFYQLRGSALPSCGACKCAAEGQVCRRCGKGVEHPVSQLGNQWHAECLSCDRCHRGFTADNPCVSEGESPMHVACAKAAVDSLSPSGAAYAKPAQSAAARAKDLKRRSLNNRPRQAAAPAEGQDAE